MESQLQQPEYIDITSPEMKGVSEPDPLAKLPPTVQSDEQWRRIGAQVSTFLAQLPKYLDRFFNEYKLPIISFVVIVAITIALRLILAILDVINDFPLLVQTFELVGIGYSIWFVNRYLFKASNRQKLSEDFQELKQEVVGNQ